MKTWGCLSTMVPRKMRPCTSTASVPEACASEGATPRLAKTIAAVVIRLPICRDVCKRCALAGHATF